MRDALAALLIGIALSCGASNAAHAILIPANQYARFDFSFHSPAPGPFDTAFYNPDGYAAPGAVTHFDIQIFDTADNLLGERSLFPLTAAPVTGELTVATGLTLFAPTTVKTGYLILGPFDAAYDLTYFGFGFASEVIPSGTELLSSPGGGLATPQIGTLPLPPSGGGGGGGGNPIPEPPVTGILLGGLLLASLRKWRSLKAAG
jgi:hypothetical protein